MLMENLFKLKEYLSLVESEIPRVATEVQQIEQQRKAIEEAKLKDLKAKNYLF